MKSAGIKFVDGTKLDTLSSIPTINVTGNILSGSTNLNALFHKKSSWVSGGTITIGAVTTAPTKGTVVTDSVNYIDNNNGTVTCVYRFRQSSAGTAGSGRYLITLPNNYQFNTTYHTFNTDFTLADIARGGIGQGSWADTYTTPTIRFGNIIPYDATRFYFAGSTGQGVEIPSNTALHLGQGIGFHFEFTFFKV